MRYVAVLNRDGGTLRSIDLDAFVAFMRATFAREGHSLVVRLVSGRGVARALKTAAARGDIDVLIAGGGDGTISSAADVAFRAGIPLAVLPAGTMNLFARALGLPLQLEEAVRAIAAGSVGRVDIATANGRPFIHQFGVGIHARLVRIREKYAFRSRIGKMLASLRAIAASAIRPPVFEVEIKSGRTVQMLHTSGISVSNNPYAEGHVPHADSLDQGVLGVYVAEPLTTGRLARLTFGVLRGKWKHMPMVTEWEVDRVMLRFPRRKRSARAVIDGELVRLDREVDLRVHRGALQVILAQAPAELPIAA